MANSEYRIEIYHEGHGEHVKRTLLEDATDSDARAISGYPKNALRLVEQILERRSNRDKRRTPSDQPPQEINVLNVGALTISMADSTSSLPEYSAVFARDHMRLWPVNSPKEQPHVDGKHRILQLNLLGNPHLIRAVSLPVSPDIQAKWPIIMAMEMPNVRNVGQPPLHVAIRSIDIANIVPVGNPRSTINPYSAERLLGQMVEWKTERDRETEQQARQAAVESSLADAAGQDQMALVAELLSQLEQR